MAPTQLPSPLRLYQESQTHSDHLLPAPQSLSSTLKWCGESPARPHKYAGGAAWGAGQGKRGAPQDREPPPWGPGQPGPPEATIHPLRSPGEGGRGNPRPRALLPPQTPVRNQPATERTGCATGYRGGPPTPRTAQDNHRLQDLTAGPAAAAPGSAEPPECMGLPEPGLDTGAGA